MTAEPAPRVVILQRAEHHWAPGYWTALLGLDVRMPAVIDGGRVLSGYLVAVEEDTETIRLSFEGLELEG